MSRFSVIRISIYYDLEYKAWVTNSLFVALKLEHKKNKVKYN